MKNFTKIGFTVVITVFSVLNSPISYSGDAKQYPGSMCVPNKIANAEINIGTIFNKSDREWLGLTCPIVKDEIRGLIGNGHIDVFDRHDLQNINCKIYSVYITEKGEIYGWTDLRKSEGHSTKVQRLSFGRLGGNMNSNYHIYCNIPPKVRNNKSGVSFYSANET